MSFWQTLLRRPEKPPPAAGVEGLFRIDSVGRGVIRRGRDYVLLYEVSPINYRLRSDEEKAFIISSYADIAKVLRRPFQITTIAEKADIQEHIQYMTEIGEYERSETIRTLIIDYLKYTQELSLSNAVSRRFIMAIPHQYEGKRTLDTALADYRETLAKLRQVFQRIGNEIVEPEDAEQHVCDLLYPLLRRYLSGTELLPDQAKMADILPSYIDDRHPQYLDIEGTYTACLIAAAIPYQVPGAWLSDLIHAGPDIEISLHCEPLPREHVLQDITRQIGFTRSKIKSGHSEADREIAESAVEHSLRIRRAMSEGEELWDICLLVRVGASSPEVLEQKLRQVETLMLTQDIRMTRASYQQLDVWLASLPFGDLPKALTRIGKRNVLTSGLGSTYPFAAYELTTASGVMLGLNAENSSPLVTDIFSYPNANMTIFGSSGSGKTYFETLLAGRLRLQNMPVMMICPYKGHEYRPYCEHLEGRYIRIAPGSEHTINILEIRKEAAARPGDSLLAAKLQSLRIFFSVMLPGIGFKEQQILDELLLETYALCGITMDNRSLFEAMQEEKGVISLDVRMKRMPTLGDLYERIARRPEMEDIALKLKPYVSGSLSMLNGQTNVDLENSFVVCDVSDMPQEAVSLAMLLILDICWDRIKRDVTTRKAIFIDEAWRLIGAGGNEATAQYLLEIFKLIRGYGGAAIAATQDIGDFFAQSDGKYGRALLNNAYIKFVLPMQAHEAEVLRDVMKLSSEEVNYITHADQGDGLLYAGPNHVTVRIQASPTEHSLITTKRADIERLRREGVR